MSGLPPETPSSFLELARVDGVYLLGCNHRQVTFYSQQTRAVNLIHSLLQTHEIREGQSIAVVGAGISGLTAAGLAAENGCLVGLYEKESEPLTIQEEGKSRWVHPHIYDWPEPGSLNDDTGDLPVLNWTAGSAENVIGQIRRGWDALLEKHSGKISFHPNSLVTSGGGAKHLLSELRKKYSVVILAVGFGKESERWGTKPYWQDDSLPAHHEGQWLISGFGDGALADLMHICISDFSHKELKDFVASVPPGGRRADELLSNEHDGEHNQEKLCRFYEELQAPEVIKLLEGRVDTNRRIVVQGREESHLYGTASAIINRFVVSQIQRLYKDAHPPDAEKFFQVVCEEWDGEPKVKGGKVFQINFKRYGSFEGALVVRHGPESALKEHFPDLWGTTKKDRKNFRDLPQQLDRTRLPMVLEGAMWNVEQRTRRREWWCLALTKEGGLEKLTTYALNKLRGQLKAWFPSVFEHGDERGHIHHEALERAIQPTAIPVSDALRDPVAYEATVRAMCRADVVIADVTDFNPAVMIFLGIRAAVRRGVTIVSSASKPKLHEYNEKVPFNLRELSIFDHSVKGIDEEAAKLAKITEKGVTSYLNSANYQDLPAYAHVRLPDIKWPSDDVLVLCPFSENYEEKFQTLKAELKRLTNQKAECRRVIDDPSPLLNSHRLFAAIRHADDCLIDWTDWRHNVFFELGVRLAVHPNGAICVIDDKDGAEPESVPESREDKDGAGSEDEARRRRDQRIRKRLKELFSPIPHSKIKEAWVSLRLVGVTLEN